MLIYEILSGLRPFHECRCSAQIKKALRRGERPSLQRSYLDSEIPELETLMTKCWKESAASRPSAEALLDIMEDSSFLCLNRVMPYIDQQTFHSITAFIPLSEEDEGRDTVALRLCLVCAILYYSMDTLCLFLNKIFEDFGGVFRFPFFPAIDSLHTT